MKLHEDTLKLHDIEYMVNVILSNMDKIRWLEQSLSKENLQKDEDDTKTVVFEMRAYYGDGTELNGISGFIDGYDNQHNKELAKVYLELLKKENDDLDKQIKLLIKSYEGKK